MLAFVELMVVLLTLELTWLVNLETTESVQSRMVFFLEEVSLVEVATSDTSKSSKQTASAPIIFT